MTQNDLSLRMAIAGLLALGAASIGTQALAADEVTEKCAGIVKAGKNDCGTTTLSCHGSVKIDSDAEAWIAVPKGTCGRIAGGRVTDEAYNAPGGLAALKK